MYLPKAFAEADPATLRTLLAAHPLGTWIVWQDGEPVANHVPFQLDASRGPHGTLIGHVARANPVWRGLGGAGDGSGARSIVVFQGAQGYVTPSWYASKREHGKVVPTWNYAVVHAHGMAVAIEDRGRLLEIVRALTGVHESGRAVPWAVEDAPADFTAQLLEAIVGIEIPLERLVGKWKMSQNRPAADRAGVAEGLLAESSGADADPNAHAHAALVRDRRA